MQRCIVITGATRGLGRALFERFSEEGHVVRGCGRNGLRTALPTGIVSVDVTDAVAMLRWAEQLGAEGITPDLLINNAGVMNTPAPLWKIDPQEFETVMSTNVAGVMHSVCAFMPAMLRVGRGVVVNISSGWGRSVDGGVAPYCASKWAIEGLTLSLADDLPQGFAAVSLNPGVIDTDMLRCCWGGGAAAYPGPQTWAEHAAPFILQLSAKDNGRQLTIPDVAT